MMKSVEDILNALDGPQDVASLSRILDESAARLGFQHYAYATLRMPQGLERPFVITNYPEGQTEELDAIIREQIQSFREIGKRVGLVEG